MEEALTFVRTHEIWFYALLGLGALYFIRKFLLAWDELRGAAFGLERDHAQSRLNHAASGLVLLITMAVIIFLLVTFIVPSLPGSIPLLTPTLDMLATPTTTLAPAATPLPGTPSVTPLLTPDTSSLSGGCLPAQVEITTPQEGDEVKGLVEVIGTVDIENFAFYKIESRRADESVWAILLAGNQVVRAGPLGVWDTRRLSPGEYELSVAPVTTDAKTLPRCGIKVRVALYTEEETP